MEPAFLCTAPLFIYWHWGKDYGNLCNELASFRHDADADASSDTDADASSDTDADASSDTDADASSSGYPATTGDTDITSTTGANTSGAAHSYNNSGFCYAD
jgi:hypothetical protein